MILADIHMHPATGRVWLSENSVCSRADWWWAERRRAWYLICDPWQSHGVHSWQNEGSSPFWKKAALSRSLEGFSKLLDGKLWHNMLVEHTIVTCSVKPACLPSYHNSLEISAIKDFPRPHAIKHVKQGLMAPGYYYRFIQDYAKIAEPLFALTSLMTSLMWTSDCQLEWGHERAVAYAKHTLSK